MLPLLTETNFFCRWQFGQVQIKLDTCHQQKLSCVSYVFIVIANYVFLVFILLFITKIIEF